LIKGVWLLSEVQHANDHRTPKWVPPLRFVMNEVSVLGYDLLVGTPLSHTTNRVRQVSLDASNILIKGMEAGWGSMATLARSAPGQAASLGLIAAAYTTKLSPTVRRHTEQLMQPVEPEGVYQLQAWFEASQLSRQTPASPQLVKK